jgi:transcriptional regulator with XRE-family HTH domain
MPVASAVMPSADRSGRRPPRVPARGGARPAPGPTGALGDAIADRRRALGLSRRELAERAALSYPFVSELERGRKSPSTASLSSLASALELTVAELVGAAEAPTAADRCDTGPGPGHARHRPGHESPAPPPAPADRPVPSLRGSQEASAELADLGRFVRDIVRDELAAAEDRRRAAAAEVVRTRPAAAAGTLVATVLDAVGQLRGDEPVAVDDQGDIPVPRDGAMVYVRVLDEPASVLVFAPVLVDLPPAAALLERLNELNTHVRFVRFCATEDGVVVDLELFGDPFDPTSLHLAVRAVGGAAARFGPELQEVFGGRLFLDAERGPDARRSIAGYL